MQPAVDPMAYRGHDSVFNLRQTLQCSTPVRCGLVTRRPTTIVRPIPDTRVHHGCVSGWKHYSQPTILYVAEYRGCGSDFQCIAAVNRDCASYP